jgi:putative isomerase
MVVGAATQKQGQRVVDEWLMAKDRFFTPHPIATVAVSDRKFELRMWRGPVWNSMTYWAARGALRYGRPLAAKKLLEAALDDTAAQYDRTGVVWEFYSPFCGKPEDLKRKPETKRNEPFTDYMGHNPLLAMARMWAAIPADGKATR